MSHNLKGLAGLTEILILLSQSTLVTDFELQGVNILLCHCFAVWLFLTIYISINEEVNKLMWEVDYTTLLLFIISQNQFQEVCKIKLAKPLYVICCCSHELR